MSRLHCTLLAMTLIGGLSSIANAHISVVSGAGFANTTQEVTFGVAHGCAGADTYRVRIEIPPSVTSARPMASDFGRVSVEKDAAGLVTAAVWQKAEADLLEADLAYYRLVIRLKVPNQPFSTVYFSAQQTCRGADGTMTTVDWVGRPTDPVADGGVAPEPAPALVVAPPRRAGWNKLTLTSAVTDLATFFADALIVWRGTAAYSSNPVTSDLIKSTTGVTALEGLAASDEIWVRY